MAANFDRSEIMRGLAIYHRSGDTFEIRVPDAGRAKTISGYFTDFGHAADAIIGRADEFAIYVTINPVNPKLIARANNRLKAYAKNTTSDTDIAKLNWLPVDGDPPRPAGISATDEEHDVSVSRIRDIRQWLIADQGWPANAFVIVDSGNGGYLLARIELANTKKNSDLVKKCLEALDYIYSDETFNVDTTSANPARILRVPGTMNAKGDEVADMKHRMARILEAPADYEVVPKEKLEALAAMLPEPEQATQSTYKASGSAFDPVAYCQAHNLPVHHTKSWTDRSGAKCVVAVLEQCVFNPEHRLSAVIIGWPNGMRSYRCRHHSCLSKHWKDAKAIIEPESATQTAYEQHPDETEAERQRREFAEANPPYLRADADRFEAEHPGCKIFNCDDDPKPNEISEEDLNALPRAENPALKINLEPDNLISIYMKYGAKTCDAYPEYHYTSVLSLLSISTNRNLVLKLSQDTLYPNIWAMNLGKTTVSRKSAAMGKFSRFADDLFPLSALPQSYSPEGLLEELTEKPKGYLVKDEAAAMIEAMEKNYMLEMRDIYCILYDCKGYRRKIRSSQRNKQSEYGAKDPYINILCATTPEAFSKHTSLIDLTSGWLLRFIYTFPTYKKPYMHFKPMSEEDQTAYAEVLSRLSYLKGLLYNRADVIDIKLDTEAWDYYQAWQEQRESELVDTGDDIQLAFFGRLAFTALKLSILFTIGRVDYTEETTVSLAHIQEATRQADSYFIPIGRIIADFVAMDETNNLQEKVLATLGRNSSRLKWTALMQKTHADKDKLEKAVAALVESEEVSEINVNSKGHKPARWILLKDINKTRSKTLKTIRYVKTKDTKDINDNKNSKDTKDSSNSGDVSGIHGIFAKKASFDSFAIHGSDGVEEVEGAPPASGPHPRKDEPTPSKQKEDPGFQKFKAGMKKRQCYLCGRTFPYDLTWHSNGDKSGYECTTCMMHGPPPEPEKTDAQSRLGDVV